MKILHLITSADKGGAESQIINLSKIQKKNGNKVLVGYFKGKGYWKQKEKKLILNIRKNKNFYTTISLLNFFLDFYHIIKLIKKFKPNIVNIHLPYVEICFFFSLFFLKKNFKLICTKHLDNNVLDGFYYNKFFPGNIISKIIAYNYDHVIAISKAVKKFYLEKKIILNQKKISVVYYGINFKYKKKNKRKFKLKEKYNIKKNQYLVGTISRLVPQKSLKFLIRSFKVYNNKYNKNSKLIIVGKGYLRNSLINYSKLINIYKDIIWINFVEDTISFLSELDIFVLSSRYEGLGLVLLESQVAGTPVVATSVGAIPEVIKNNYNGKLITHGNIKKFSKSLINIPKSKFVNNGYRVIKKKFNEEIMYKKIINIYNK